MFDPIRPPAARRPEEALELVSQALSDGDLEAALAQYEKGALLACWPGAGEAGQAGEVGQVLAGVMALRLPLYVRISSVLESPELALVICERRVAGTGPDGERVWFTRARLRRAPAAAGRRVADRGRRLARGNRASPDPPEIPPGSLVILFRVRDKAGSLTTKAVMPAGTGHDDEDLLAPSGPGRRRLGRAGADAGRPGFWRAPRARAGTTSAP